jgi:hypothetical protein
MTAGSDAPRAPTYVGEHPVGDHHGNPGLVEDLKEPDVSREDQR